MSLSEYLKTSTLGMVRGTTVVLLTFPLQTIKTRLQVSPPNITSTNIIYNIFQQKGISGFYSGLIPKLIDTNIKQFWAWQVIKITPSFLEKHHLEPLPAQALTGVFIATIDASTSTPFDVAKIRSMLSEKKWAFSSFSIKDSWSGFKTNWCRLTVQWTAFLTAQKYFRDQYKIQEEKLTLSELVWVGIKTAGLVSLIAAPFDTANTLAQVSKTLFQRTPLHSYRGLPYSTLSLIIHNTASVTLLEYLEKK